MVMFATAVGKEVAVADEDDVATEVEEARTLLFDDCAWTALKAAVIITKFWRKEVRILVSGRWEISCAHHYRKVASHYIFCSL